MEEGLERPQASFDTQIDHNDKCLDEKNENKWISVGDMEAQGEQMSKKRAQENGVKDPLRNILRYKNVKKKKHPKDPKGGGKIYYCYFKSSE